MRLIVGLPSETNVSTRDALLLAATPHQAQEAGLASPSPTLTDEHDTFPALPNEHLLEEGHLLLKVNNLLDRHRLFGREHLSLL
jgi:hypothetical protein